MNIDFESIQQQLLRSQADKLPEPYRSKYMGLIRQSEDNIKSKAYSGTAETGLLTIEVDSQGAIKKFNIANSLIQKIAIATASGSHAHKQGEYNKFNQQISDLCKVAHADAIEGTKKGLNEELTNLYSKLELLAKEYNEDRS